MSDDLFPSEKLSQAASLSKTTERLLKILIVLAILATIALLVGLVVNSFSPLERIEISNTQGMTQPRVFEIAEIGSEASFWEIDAQKVSQNLLSVPSIKNVKVIKRFPSTIQIQMENRTPVAMTMTLVDGRPVALLVDEQGAIFEAIGSAYPAIPLISDQKMQKPVPGERFSPLLLKLFVNLAALDPSLLALISEIEINWKSVSDYESFDLVLYLVYTPVRVCMKADLNSDELQYATTLLDALHANGIRANVLDVRSGIPSYW
jgi:cell division protein FtsQ